MSEFFHETTIDEHEKQRKRLRTEEANPDVTNNNDQEEFIDLPFCVTNADYTKYYQSNKQHDGDDGWDLVVPERVVVPAGARAFKVPLGIRVASPVALDLIPRSSVGKTPLRQVNNPGRIDKPYRGEVLWQIDNIAEQEIILQVVGSVELNQETGKLNIGYTPIIQKVQQDYVIEAGTRLCQLSSKDSRRLKPRLVDQQVIDDAVTTRGSGGFGSTGSTV